MINNKYLCIMKKKKNGYWTNDRITKAAHKCTSKSSFKKKYPTAYKKALKINLLDDICSHMERPDIKKWTFNKLKIIALKYNHRVDFSKHDTPAYASASRQGILDDICSHMERPVVYNKKCTYDKLKIIALKYNHRIDFINDDKNAHQAAYRMGILDDICNHMENIGNKNKRCVYVFEFDNNIAYVGLTYRLDYRIKQHITKNKKESQVYKHINQTKSKYKVKQLTGYICEKEASEKEIHYNELYKKNGWYMLSSSSFCGALGGNNVIWTLIETMKRIKECKTKRIFREKYPSGYGICKKNGWLYLYNTLIKERYPKGYWSIYNNCKKHANECSNRSDFAIKYYRGYKISSMNGWLGDFFPN